MKPTKTFVLYHANCSDGFGAAWSAWRKLGNRAAYIPGTPREPPPELPNDAAVYILDFCYRREVIHELMDKSRELRIIDHHKTAEEELEGLACGHFDMSKSGAVLAWEHFHPDREVPELLRYVMDHDLWQHELPNSREVAAALSAHPQDFDLWSTLAPAQLAREGVPIRRYQRQLVDTLSAQARFEEVAGYTVPVANAPMLGSEVGEELLRRHADAPFAVMYFDRGDGIRQWSLRSREDFDVSTIARRFQNGGHRQAAGFETPLPAAFVPKPKSPTP